MKMISHKNFETTMKMNCWKLSLLFITAFSVLFFAVPALAQSTLQVKCVDSSGAPVQGAKVVIAPVKNLQKSKDKKSDAQGVVDFGKLDDGAYRVFGRKEGFAPALYEFAALTGSPQTVTLKFAPGADKKLYFEDDLVFKSSQGMLGAGVDALKQNKFPEAEKLLDESLAINPSSPDALYYLAVSRLSQGKFEEASQTLDKTIQVASVLATLPSQGPAGQPNRNEIIIKSAQDVKKKLPAMKAEDALRNKNYESAIKQYSELIKTDPTVPDYHANLATALYYSRRFDEALVAMDAAIKLKPGDAAYTNVRNTIAARRENAELEKAQAVLDEGNKLFQDGDAASALKKFEEAKGMVPQDKQSPIWRQIGRAQAKLNQPQAVDSFKKSIELAPADKAAEYRNSLAQYYMDAKKYDEAAEALLDPKSSENQEKVLLGLAKSWMNKEPKLSEAVLERVLKINPDNMDAVFDLGQMYYSDGKEKDSRTKELLTKYTEKGQDAGKVENAKNMLVIVNRRTK